MGEVQLQFFVSSAALRLCASDAHALLPRYDFRAHSVAAVDFVSRPAYCGCTFGRPDQNRNFRDSLCSQPRRIESFRCGELIRSEGFLTCRPQKNLQPRSLKRSEIGASRSTKPLGVTWRPVVQLDHSRNASADAATSWGQMSYLSGSRLGPRQRQTR
jgi:hypothetical protein